MSIWRKGGPTDGKKIILKQFCFVHMAKPGTTLKKQSKSRKKMMRETYDADEVKEFDERRVEKVVLVRVGGERVDDRAEQVEPRDVSVIELILETNALPQ